MMKQEDKPFMSKLWDWCIELMYLVSAALIGYLGTTGDLGNLVENNWYVCSFGIFIFAGLDKIKNEKASNWKVFFNALRDLLAIMIVVVAIFKITNNYDASSLKIGIASFINIGALLFLNFIIRCRMKTEKYIIIYDTYKCLFIVAFFLAKRIGIVLAMIIMVIISEIINSIVISGTAKIVKSKKKAIKNQSKQ